MSRIISWFSCGAASAYATYLASNKYGDDLLAVYCRVAEEHPDNLKFLEEFQDKTGIVVTIIGDHNLDYSIYNVFRKRRFIKSPYGAPCTTVLKKNPRKAFQQDGDIQIFGYTLEEENRANRFIDSNPDVETDFILIDEKITKSDCIAWMQANEFSIPTMYKLGYPNNNCIPCVKGGAGYFNAIRKDFPEEFDRMAKLEREIGHAILKDKDGPVYLDELEPHRGRFERDLPSDCGFSCEWIEKIEEARS